ncbi:MAG: class I SAM-dependent rRNA methyltransferase [Saprospiraceae bacterium]|nr:class I SAM-dependent rRNA methyltransferase [Saprospiraceae bacterium]
MQKLTYPRIIIKQDRLASISRRHPWIFSKGIQSKEDVQDGDLVSVHDPAGHFLASGHYHDSSIAIRILSFDQPHIDQSFWDGTIAKCLTRRKKMFLPTNGTNAYRLVHGEGDNLSGLIIDIYDQVAVVQCHTIGMHRSLNQIEAALRANLGAETVIFDKSKNALPPAYAKQQSDGFITGNKADLVIEENHNKFSIDLALGQKTGFFLDQRDNRKLLSYYAKDQKILNLYCYTGGFSVYALNAGAKEVCSIDVSARAMDTLTENLKLNKIDNHRHQSIIGDVKKILPDLPDQTYDIIVVDPPAFAKSQFKSHNAVQAYKRINAMAISKVKPGGLIFTFSCSQVIDQTLFQNTITAAAIESGRDCRILHILSQAPDHPISIFHPEGKYLKGLVLEVE